MKDLLNLMTLNTNHLEELVTVMNNVKSTPTR